MYNVVIGQGPYREIIIDLLLEKKKLVIAVDKKENLQSIKNRKILKLEVNIENVKLVENAILNQPIENVYIITNDDKLNLMLGEQLSDKYNTNVFLSDEKISALVDKNYKLICTSLLIKEFINKEIE